MDYDRFLSRVAITFRGRGTFEKVALLEALLQRYISDPPLDIGCSARRSRFHQPRGLRGWGSAAQATIKDKQDACHPSKPGGYFPSSSLPKYSQRCSAIGTFPFFQTKSWKARRLNLSPCCRRASASNCMIWSLPIW